METAEIRELISAFVPEEILRDFELKEVNKECGATDSIWTRRTTRAIIPLSWRRRRRWSDAAT